MVDELQARDIFPKLTAVTSRFLTAQVRHLGYIPRDENLHRAIMAQRPVVEAFPLCPASRALAAHAPTSCWRRRPPARLESGLSSCGSACCARPRTRRWLTTMHRALSTISAPTGRATTSCCSRYGRSSIAWRAGWSLRTGMHSAYDDLWSAGALGLLEAAPAASTPSGGVTFETFVEHRIRGAMLDELRRMDHLPRRLRSRTDDLKKARHKLGAALGREATTEELAAEMKHRPRGGLRDGGPARASGAAGERDPPAGRRQRRRRPGGPPRGPAHAGRRHRTVPERLRLVLSLIYIEGLTYSEIGGLLGVSEPRVCQLHSEALVKLREEMGIAPPR